MFLFHRRILSLPAPTGSLSFQSSRKGTPTYFLFPHLLIVPQILRVDISDVRIMVEGQWTLTGITGIDPNLFTSGPYGTGRGPAGWIQQHRQPLVIADLSHTEVPVGSTMKSLGIHGYVGVPLFSRGGEVIGVLRA